MKWVGISKSEFIDWLFAQEFIGCFSPLHQVVTSLDIFNNIMHLLSVMIFVTQEDHQQKKHMHLMRPHCVLTPVTWSLCAMRAMHPEFSSSVHTLPMLPESVPNASIPLLRTELWSNHPLHLDLMSPLFSIS